MKKALAVILAALSALCLMGCEKGAPQQKAGGKAIEEFITHIAAGEYAEAYALLSSSCRNDTEEEKANRVTEKQFTDKYTSIISALEITAIEYAGASRRTAGTYFTAQAIPQPITAII